MEIGALIQYAAAMAVLAVAVYAALREPASVVRRVFLGGLVLLALEAIMVGTKLQALMPGEMAAFERLRMLVLSFVPGTWLVFSLVYARGNYREFLDQWRWLVAVAFLVPPAMVLVFWSRLITGWDRAPGGVDWMFDLGAPSMALLAMVVAGIAAVLMNLENTLRASAGTMRWRIKFMVFGLCLFFAVRIYTLSQSLLYSSVRADIEILNAGALVVACLLMAKSLHRSDLMKVDLYLSHRLIFTSLTVVLVGVYLLVVGAMAQVLTYLGGAAAFPLKALTLFIAAVGLMALMMSDRIRLVAKRFVSRHFQRPLHDYREIWAAFTDRTASMTDQTAFCREVARFVSETFETLSVTVWLVDEPREALVFGASTSMSDTQAHTVSGGGRMPPALAGHLRRLGKPVDLDKLTGAEWVEALKASNPDFFQKGGTRLCMSLIAGDELLGLMIMGDRVNGLPYSLEDTDLFRTLCDQAAAKLLGIRLSERLLQAKEIEAFQTMSAFFVHDLKNTASTLSLMLANLPRHFEDPEFRADALKAMDKSVTKINDVIRRLTALRQKLEVHPLQVDLNTWIRGVLEEVEGPERGKVSQDLKPVPPVRIDPALMSTVLTNLVLNAREAVRDTGSISVRTESRDGWAIFSVIDTGCGMPREFIEKHLFRPFQTTRKEGMGIGLFQSRMIVEAHRGRMEVESEPGHGSIFRVLVPLFFPGAAPGKKDAAGAGD